VNGLLSYPGINPNVHIASHVIPGICAAAVVVVVVVVVIIIIIIIIISSKV